MTDAPVPLPLLLGRVAAELDRLAGDAAALQQVTADMTAGGPARMITLQRLDHLTQILEQLSRLSGDLAGQVPEAPVRIGVTLHSLHRRLHGIADDDHAAGDAVLF